MPCVRIATGTWAKGAEKAVMEAVHSALVSAFNIPDDDRDIVLDLYRDAHRLVSRGRSNRYTRVEIVGIASRSLDAKLKLFATVVENLEVVGVPRHETRIVLIEPPAESWGVQGGQPASMVDLGFRIDV